MSARDVFFVQSPREGKKSPRSEFLIKRIPQRNFGCGKSAGGSSRTPDRLIYQFSAPMKSRWLTRTVLGIGAASLFRDLLAIGYGCGALTGLLLAFQIKQPVLIGSVFALGGLYVGIEETVEDAVAADLLPKDIRGTGFGSLAVANGIGDTDGCGRRPSCEHEVSASRMTTSSRARLCRPSL